MPRKRKKSVKKTRKKASKRHAKKQCPESGSTNFSDDRTM